MADAETQAQTEQSKGPTAPYPAFQTLKTLTKSFKEHGPPNKIDRSVLTSFSGAVGSQVLTMLRFLRLMDPDGRPTPKMQNLVDAYDTDAWAGTLSDVVREAYSPLFKTNLETASPKEFNDEFRRAYPAADEVSRKSMTFFLNAARDAGIKISPYIMKNKKPRSATPKRRASKSTGATGKHDIPPPPPPPPPADTKGPSELLLSLLDPVGMKQPEQDAIWTLLKYFKSKGQ